MANIPFVDENDKPIGGGTKQEAEEDVIVLTYENYLRQNS